MAGFAHIDPTTTFVYREHTIIYGFEKKDFCFTCFVQRGYLIGRRDSLPEGMEWAIGQHIDTLTQLGIKSKPLTLATLRKKKK